MLKAVNDLSQLHFGHIENFTITSNNSKVYFLCKQAPPQDKDEALVFSRRLADIGMSLPRYIEAYETDDDESARHQGDYLQRKEGEKNGTPRKRQRLDDGANH